MGKPYSMDLRERAVGAVLRGGLSRHKSAQPNLAFGISTVINWVRRFQDTGSVVARPDRRAQAEGDCRRASGLSGARRVPGRRVYAAARARARTRRAPPQESIIDRCGTSSTPKSLASKKPSSPASAIDPTSRAGASSGRTGQSRIDPERLAFIDETWTKTNMAPAQRMGDARGRGSWPRFLTGHWKTLTFLAALRHDCIEGSHGCSMASINAEGFKRSLCRESVGPHPPARRSW